MSYRLKTLPAAILLCCLPVSAVASGSTYVCKILQAVELSDSGKLGQPEGVWPNQVGKTFTVNRTTGEMIGGPFATDAWLGGVKVLYPGDKMNGYTALVLSGEPNPAAKFRNVSSKYIYIAEQNEGPSKPFWGSGLFDGMIFSGTCN